MYVITHRHDGGIRAARRTTTVVWAAGDRPSRDFLRRSPESGDGPGNRCSRPFRCLCTRQKKKNGFRIIKKRTQYVIIIVRIDRTRARNAIYAHGGDDNNNRRDDNNNLYESV